MTASNYRRPRPRPAPPVTPGLGPDSLLGLDPATANARLVAAEERIAEVRRSSTARNLAERVAASAPPQAPESPSPAPEVPQTPNGPQGGSQAREDTSTTRTPPPIRKGDITIPTRRAEKSAAPPEFTEADLAVLARLLGTERKADGSSEPDSLRFSGPAPRLRTPTRNPRPGRNLR